MNYMYKKKTNIYIYTSDNIISVFPIDIHYYRIFSNQNKGSRSIYTNWVAPSTWTSDRNWIQNSLRFFLWGSQAVQLHFPQNSWRGSILT